MRPFRRTFVDVFWVIQAEIKSGKPPFKIKGASTNLGVFEDITEWVSFMIVWLKTETDAV